MIIPGERDSSSKSKCRYRGSTVRSLKHAIFAHARSASSHCSWPAMPIASSTGSRGGPLPPAGDDAGGESRNRIADARTTTPMMVATTQLAAGRAAASALAAPLFLPPLMVADSQMVVVVVGESAGSPARRPHGIGRELSSMVGADTSGDTCWDREPPAGGASVRVMPRRRLLRVSSRYFFPLFHRVGVTPRRLLLLTMGPNCKNHLVINNKEMQKWIL